MKLFQSFYLILVFLILPCFLWSIPPVLNYSGQVKVEGVNFDGSGFLKFAFVNADGNLTHWSQDGTSVNGSEPEGSVSVQVQGGLYSILLGNTAIDGMGSIDPFLFSTQSDLHLRVWFSDGVNGFERIVPDRPFASVPYAFSAGSAQSVVIADGSINKSMLGSDVIADLNATIGVNRLSAEVAEKLDRNTTTNNYNAPSAGSLLAVSHGSPSPAGYSLYQSGEPKKLIWEEIAPLSEGRGIFDGIDVIDGKIYASGPGGTVERYSILTNTWESISPMSSVRYTVAFTVLNQKLYAIGGVLNGVSLASVEIYDPISETWSEGVELPAGVNRCEAITVNGKIYVVGGWNSSSQNTGKVFCFDPSANIWTYKQDMPTARHGHKLVWFEDRIWAIGGSDGISNLRKVESFDPVTNIWQVEASLEVARHWPTAWVASNRVYVGGSWNPWIDSIECYNPNTSMWKLSDTLPENKGFCGSVVAGGKLYLASGETGSGLKSDKLHVADLNAQISGVFNLYRKDGDVSAGTPIVQTEVMDNSISTSKISNGAVTSSKIADRSISPLQLSEQILKYLRPEITQSPVLTKSRKQVYTGQTISLSSDAEGKFLSYQWLKDGEPVLGATSRGFTIIDANGSLHNGNYTVQVSNDFGSVSSEDVQIDVNDTQLIHQINLNSTVSLEMILVEPGKFTMGQGEVATPVHEVTLTKGFYLGKYEVTQAQYEAVMTGNSDGLSATPSNFTGNPNHPVENVSWEDIQVFLTRLNAQEAGNIPAGWGYVLPTEAQWEYACRAGTTTAFSWGDTITTDHANYRSSGYSQTRDVGLYSANPWGFFDMHGNVEEWTADAWDHYASGAQTDPFNAGVTGSRRVYRGGSYSSSGPDYSGHTRLHSASRGIEYPGNPNIRIGFRVGFQQLAADVASPEMQILGDANITHLQDTAWVDPGVEAHDVRDGNITDSITVSGSVDVNTTGTYTLTYTVSDAAGNEASLTRTVNVGIPSNYATDLNSTVSLEMIWVEPGTFTMGQDGYTYAEPEHEVTLTNGYYLGKYEVTQAQYEAVMKGNSEGLNAKPSEFDGNPDRPVENISYNDIQVFLTILNSQQAGSIPEDWSYVLPTEAEWVYASRANTFGNFWFGDTFDDQDANLNGFIGHTVNVGSYIPNPWGFYDTIGNVREWTADAENTFTSASKINPYTEGYSSSNRIIKGGGWKYSTDGNFARGYMSPSSRTSAFGDALYGFRLALKEE